MKIIDSTKDSITIKISPVWIYVMKRIQPIKCILGFHVWDLEHYSICLYCGHQYEDQKKLMTGWYNDYKYIGRK